MLRHLETAPGTASVRVSNPPEPQPFTAEEIADAIAELEKEQRHKSLGQNGVAQIASVLEQLHLDLPAEAVTEQIEARRRIRLHEKQTRRRKRIATAMAVALCSLCAIVAVPVLLLKPVKTTITETTPVLSNATGIAREVIPARFLVNVREPNGQWITKTLGEVEDGVRVQLAGDNLVHLMKLGPNAGASSFAQDYKWQVFREKGEWYLRGYTGTARSRSALLAEPIAVYNAKDTMGSYHATPVIIPLGSVVVENSSTVDGQEHRLDLRVTDANKVIFGK